MAFIEKGNPRQPFTSFTACVGAEGKVVMLSVTSFEARIQVPAGKVVYRMKALSFDPCKEDVAITESTARPFIVQR